MSTTDHPKFSRDMASLTVTPAWRELSIADRETLVDDIELCSSVAELSEVHRKLVRKAKRQLAAM